MFVPSGIVFLECKIRVTLLESCRSKAYLCASQRGLFNSTSYAVSGIFATIVHDAVMNPAEVSQQMSIYLLVVRASIKSHFVHVYTQSTSKIPHSKSACAVLTRFSYFQVVKQRMQMIFSPYGNSLECVRCIYMREGIKAFYRSYITQLTLNIPYQCTHFMIYEFMQEMLNPQHRYNASSHLVSGGKFSLKKSILALPFLYKHF